MAAANELAAVLRRDLTRLAQELAAFPAEELLWETRPGVTNSAGNLFLHLEGNMREYIGRRLGGVEYQRQRPLEFSSRNVPAAELATRLRGVLDLIPPIVAALSADALEAHYPQDGNGPPATTRQYLMHLIAHLNYHLGQIDCLRRVLTGDAAIELAQL